VTNEKIRTLQALIKDYKADRIYRIFRIIFAFPEERQKLTILFEKTDWTNSGKGWKTTSLFPPLGGIVLSQSILETEKNPKNPVHPVDNY
jgi:hypothetical protein